uniref:DUF3778 domain-containing protein n=1 Tax=Oryza glaberrima TaxID=4538 RepID=I1R7X5_ORYGL
MPARSVLRCRCLSLAWAAALSSDAFVGHHLRLPNRRRHGPKLCIPPSSLTMLLEHSLNVETIGI